MVRLRLAALDRARWRWRRCGWRLARRPLPSTLSESAGCCSCTPGERLVVALHACGNGSFDISSSVTLWGSRLWYRTLNNLLHAPNVGVHTLLRHAAAGVEPAFS